MQLDQFGAILELIRASGGEIYGRTRMQKLMFLAQEEGGLREKQFRYIGWDYGPFSRDLQVCINTLVNLELLVEGTHPTKSGESAYRYVLTDGGRALLEQAPWNPVETESGQIARLVREWGSRNLDELIRHVYARNPEFTERSKLDWAKE